MTVQGVYAQDVEQWKRELVAAGWHPSGGLDDLWVDPTGKFCRGTFNAWLRMNRTGYTVTLTDQEYDAMKSRTGVDANALIAFLQGHIDPHDSLNPKYADLRRQIEAIRTALCAFAAQAPGFRGSVIDSIDIEQDP